MKTSRTIEVTVISAEDLRLRRRQIKKNAFVVVSASQESRSTTVDTDGGSNPSWNEKLELPLLDSTLFVSVEVQCKSGSGSKKVGGVRIPVSDFAGSFVRFLSYRLRESDGERNGIINLSIKVKGGAEEVDQLIMPPPPPPPSLMVGRCYGGGDYYCRSGVAAIGVPVQWGKINR